VRIIHRHFGSCSCLEIFLNRRFSLKIAILESKINECSISVSENLTQSEWNDWQPNCFFNLTFGNKHQENNHFCHCNIFRCNILWFIDYESFKGKISIIGELARSRFLLKNPLSDSFPPESPPLNCIMLFEIGDISDFKPQSFTTWHP